MDENNNNTENRLNTVLGVEEDKSVGSKINNFVKKLKGIPESREVPLRPRADFRKANKELTQNLKKWEKFGKKQAGNPLVNYFFGDKHKVKATKRLFADLEKTARKSTQKYNSRLNDLLGQDREKNKGKGFSYTGEIGDTRTAFQNNLKKQKLDNEQLNKLYEERNKLLEQQKSLNLLPNEEKTLSSITKAQKELDILIKKRDEIASNRLNIGQGKKTVDTDTEKIMLQSKELNKLAGGLYGRTGDESLFKALEKDISATTKEDEKSFADLSKQLKSWSGKKGAYIKKLNAQRELYAQSPTNEMDAAITETEAELNKIQNEINRLSSDKEVAAKHIQVDKKRKAQFDYYYENKNKPQDFANDKNYKTEEFAAKFDAMMRKKTTSTKEMTADIGKFTTAKQLENIDSDIDNTRAKIQMLQDSLSNISTDADLGNVQKELEEKNKEIDKSEKELIDAKKQGKQLLNVFHDMKLECQGINRELKLLNDDMQIDPFDYQLEASDLQKYNDTVEDIKSGVAGIGSNWKKSNVFTRLLGRMLINIRSQIADMFNPFTKFRQGWDAWLNRWYNLPWKNTFDVIAYNLVTAFAPVFEWMAKALIKVAQVANVFIKRWTGVDLFDKSAWQLEQINKGMGQLTASFDELHSNTDNPNQFNTIFDTDPAAVSPLSEELTSKLEKWADRIANAFKWIKDNWLLLVGLWAGFKLAKGLLNLLDWAGKLNNLFGTTLPGSFGKFLRGLGWVAAGISAVVSAYETIKLGTKWDQMDDKEKNKTIGKSIGFGTLAGGLVGGLLGGPAGAAIGAGIGAAITGGIDSAIADYNGDDARAEITGAIGGAGIGATIGTLIAPGIGTAIGAAVGAGIGWGVEKLGHLTFSNGGDYSNLKISTEDLAWANEQLAAAQDNAYDSMYNLKLMEEQTGESGKQLYEAVKNGSLSYDDMTSSQLAVYKAYEQHMEVLDELHKAQQTQMDYETSMDMDRAKKTDNYGSYIEKMIQANKDGIYSNEELEDRFAQMYGELDRGSRQAFLEQLPENMRTGIETAGREYMSNWSKFYDDCCNNWETFKTNAVQMWEDVKTGAAQKWEDFKTGAVETWQNVKDSISTKWEEIKTNTAETWENIKTNAGEKWEEIKNSAVGKKVQEIATNVSTKWNELKSNTTQKFQDIASKANEKWQSIKNTVTTKANEAWTNTKSKWEQLKNDSRNAFENIWNTAKTKFGDIAKTIGDKAKEAWEKAKGWFEDIGKKAKEAWEGVKSWGSNIGKGWETEGFGGAVKATFGLASYDVGTNYVPNDQLAMVHKGEAIIPAKYNKPYSPQSNNSDLEYTIAAMTQEISNLRTLIQGGIPVKGEFKQRGSDLVAVVEKGKNRNGNQTLSNPAYAR